ncbi:Non-repetitive/WGA-negative nucleoporin C-terminal-domain-containing protein, partial [Blyttiomyces helicus]
GVYMLSKNVLQKWNLFSAQPEKFIFEADIEDLFWTTLSAEKLQLAFVEAVDMAVLKDDILLVLVAYRETQAYEDENGDYCSYALIYLQQTRPNVSEVTVIAKKDLGFMGPQPTRGSLHASERYSSAVFIAFPNAIVITSAVRDVKFEETIPPNSTIFGLGLDENALSSDESDSDHSRAVYVCGDGLFRIDARIVSPKKQGPPTHAIQYDEAERSTDNLIYKLEQAVFFGTDEAKPISFDLTQSVSGDLDRAFLDVSSSVLLSTSKHLQGIMETKMQLMDRKKRIGRIQQEATRVLNRLSPTTRYTLCYHAEQLQAAQSLWNHQNKILGGRGDKSRKEPHQKLLASAIDAYMRDNVPEIADDNLRAFFRSKIPHMQEVLHRIQATLQERPMMGSLDAQERFLGINEANNLLLMVYRAAIEYRQEEGVHRYHIDPRVFPVEPWTATLGMIDLFQVQFEMTERAVKHASDRVGVTLGMVGMGRSVQDADVDMVIDGDEGSAANLKRQLAELADKLLSSMSQRRAFLNWLTAMCPHQSVGGREADLSKLDRHYAEIQEKIFRPLVQYGQKDKARLLAEKFEDFSTLVSLTDNDPGQIQGYMRKFGYSFAKELYKMYLAQGNYAALMSQQEYSGYLDEFLAAAKVPWLAWLHSINMNRPKAASEQLMEAAASEPNLQKFQTTTSMAKLAFLMHASDDELESGLIAFDSSLTLCAIATRLRNTLLMALPPSAPMTLESRYDLIMHALFEKSTEDYEAVATECLGIVRRSLDGQNLSPAEMVDVFTLFDTDKQDWFSTALNVIRDSFKKEKKLLPIVRVSLKTLWRRAYTATNWREVIEARRVGSDESIAALLRGTPLYALFTIAHVAIRQPANYFQLALDFNECLYAPDEDDQCLLARPFGEVDQDLPAIRHDYRRENELLKHLQETCMLKEFVAEILRMVAEDQEVNI